MATFPYNWTPEKHQLPILQNRARFKVLVWHRKARKTTLAINELFRWAAAIKGTYWYVAPFLSQAKKIVWQDPEMASKYCPLEIWDKRNNSELYVPFPNGSVVYIMGADSPQSLRGPNPRGVVLDEYDDMKSEVWSQIIQPIMAANPNAWCWFVGTPRGRRDLFRKFEFAESEMREKGRESEWFATKLKASESGLILAEALAAVKRDPGTPEDFYKQEYEVEFLEGAGTFFKNLESVLYEPSANQDRIGVHPKKRYQIGIDWAKVNDFTVFTPLDLTNFYILPQERFNQIDYNLQQARAEAAYLKYNKARVQMDSTGIGMPIFDSLQRSIPKLEEYIFTEQSRKDLLENLKLKITTQTIRIPNEPVLRSELESFQYYLTPHGKVRIQCADNQHDDCFVKGTMIVTNKGQMPIETISIGDMVMTRDGYKPVLMIRNRLKKVIKNIGLIGTPDHPVITVNGEKPLCDVSNYDKLHIWNPLQNRIEKLSYIEAKNIIDTQILNEDNLKFTIGGMINGKLRQYHYIDNFGKMPLGRYLKDLLFTIKTKIRSIINYQILSFYLGGIMPVAIYGQNLNLKKDYVNTFSVEKYSRIETEYVNQDSADIYVGQETEMVYNLQISEKPEYFANNILVHNCVMSLALAVWDMPVKTVNYLYNEERELLKQFDAHRNKPKIFAGIRYKG